MILTQEYLKEILNYNAHTGIFTWKRSMPPRAFPGKIAGHQNGNGYKRISINGKKFYQHQLAFLFMTGSIPQEVDHINHVRADNRWSNLRPSNRFENAANVPGRSGVRKKYGRWYARYCHTHLGVFDTEEEARRVRKMTVIERTGGIDPDAIHQV